MGRILYLQCDTGISGDMVVGALLDAGASEQGLRSALCSLPLAGYSIRISRKKVGSLAGCDFDVVMDERYENHDHDMEWLYGRLDECGATIGADHHGQHHAHRTLADVREIINQASLTERARTLALRIFEIIAKAEARAHGESIDSVHFHEVGAIDSIVDVVAVAWCIDDLAIEDVVVSPLTEGEGYIRCAHGVLSIPVPAVTHIVEEYGLVLRRAHRRGEFVTPTGAAIAAALHSVDGLPETYRIIARGIGCGKRGYEKPSNIQALLVEGVSEGCDVSDDTPIWKLETEVDDCTGEALGYVLERLYESGALEAHFLPVFMKKGRPGYQIEVLCEEEHIETLEKVLFTDTTTIGIRRYAIARTTLVRRLIELTLPFGLVRAKVVTLPGGNERIYPEHDSIAQIAHDQGIAYQDAMRMALESCESCQLSTE